MPARWVVRSGSAEQLDAPGDACLWDPSVLAEIGDAELTTEVLALFARQVGEALPQLGEAIDNVQGERARELAHRLKGSSATVGALGIAALCDALCTAVDGGRSDAVRALYLRIVDAWGETSSAITAQLERP